MNLNQWLFQKICNYFNATQKNIKPRAYLCDYDRICHEIIPGDVLLIEGTNRVSQIIRRTTHSPWTHAALYIGRLHSVEDPRMRNLISRYYRGSPSHQLLIESLLGRGTLITPINFYQKHHIRICRPVGLSGHDTQKIINFAISHLGRQYDTRHVLDLWRFLLPKHLYIPRKWFSVLFGKTETSKEICSSMIAEAFMSIKYPILPVIRENAEKNIELIQRNPKLFAPSDFDYSPYFAIIKYPIYPRGERIYSYLPWNETLISHDEAIKPVGQPPEKKDK